jgi:hypothetical protein
MSNYLFAIDEKTEEVIVSESPKGSTKISLIERISRQNNEMLYHAVQTLTLVSKDEELDMSLFKAMDKVCQGIYARAKKS